MIKINNKGISPIITTVLLISLVIVLGLIVFTWSKGFLGERVTKFENEDIENVCDRVELDAEYYENGGNYMILRNKGNVPVYKIMIKTEFKGKEDIEIKEESLGVAEIKEISFSGAEFSSIKVIPVLLGLKGDSQVEYTCKDKFFEVESGV